MQRAQNGQNKFKKKEKKEYYLFQDLLTNVSIGKNSTDIDEPMCGELVFDKMAKSIQWRKDNLFYKRRYNKWILI